MDKIQELTNAIAQLEFELESQRKINVDLKN